MSTVVQTCPSTKKHSRIWSVPNLLTYGRLLAVPLLAGCFYLEAPLSHWLAFALFVAASVTDFFDGYLARAWHQQSRLGRMLDPVADKVLVAIAIVMLFGNGTIDGWSWPAVVIILGREIIVSGLRQELAEYKASLPVSNLAKIKTTLQMVAIGMLLIAPVCDSFLQEYWPGRFSVTGAGAGLFSASALVTLYTGWQYLRVAWPHLGEEE